MKIHPELYKAQRELNDIYNARMDMATMQVTVKPSWWVRILCAFMSVLWKCGLQKASWKVADFRFWLHDKGLR